MTGNRILAVAFSGLLLAFAGCGAAGDALGPQATDLARGRSDDSSSTTGSPSSGSASVGQLRLRCEVRSGRRSKISVDGRNLPVGAYQATVRSGGNTATSGVQRSIGDEVEFDFDSDAGDIAEGATAIAADFIDTSASPHVTASIVDAGGSMVADGAADCRVR